MRLISIFNVYFWKYSNWDKLWGRTKIVNGQSLWNWGNKYNHGVQYFVSVI